MPPLPFRTGGCGRGGDSGVLLPEDDREDAVSTADFLRPSCRSSLPLPSKAGDARSLLLPEDDNEDSVSLLRLEVVPGLLFREPKKFDFLRPSCGIWIDLSGTRTTSTPRDSKNARLGSAGGAAPLPRRSVG